MKTLKEIAQSILSDIDALRDSDENWFGPFSESHISDKGYDVFVEWPNLEITSRELKRALNTGNTERQRIEVILKQLSDIDCTLAEIVMDYQDQAEAQADPSSGFGDICVPEDANEEVDGVRLQIDGAMTQLQRYLDALPT